MRALWLSALLLFGCSPKERTDYLIVIEEIAPKARGKNHPAEPGRYKTLWLTAAGSGYREVASHDGIALSDGKTVWFWSDTAEKRETARCDCLEKKPTTPEELSECFSVQEFPRGAFYDLFGKELAKRPDPKSAPSAATQRTEEASLHYQSIELLGNVGPWLFYSTHSYTFFCSGSPKIVKKGVLLTHPLRDGEQLPWSKAEQDAYLAPHIGTAKHNLCSTLLADSPEACLKTPFEPELKSLFPRFREGALEFLVELSIPVTTDATRGGEQDKTTQIPFATTPSFLAELGQMPPLVKDYWTQNKTKMMGISRIRGVPEELDSLSKTFLQAPPMNPKVEPSDPIWLE